MIPVKLRSEYSIRYASGRLPDLLDRVGEVKAAALTDRGGTWGHIPWEAECRKRGIKPLFGVELMCVPDMDDRDDGKKVHANPITIIARTLHGLTLLHEAVGMATEKFYYYPRIDYGYLRDLDPQNRNLIMLTGPSPLWGELPGSKRDNWFIELNPWSTRLAPQKVKEFGMRPVATMDNYFVDPSFEEAYQVIVGKFQVEGKTTMSHVLSAAEMRACWSNHERLIEEAIANTHVIADLCDDISIPRAKMVSPPVEDSLEEMCRKGAKKRGINLQKKEYKERLKRELDLIYEKKFEDYFYVVADLVRWAKKRMLVGPARGSSCGSLVCYLIDITDIDPIPYDLLFERFIDLNREDYPDIDIDFEDTRRAEVFAYLGEAYGEDHVAHLGTIVRFKPKNAITDCARELDIPSWEVKEVKDSIVERSTGDARAQFCIADTFELLDVGKRALERHPNLLIASDMEGHARHTGVHAAGILVSADPISRYVSKDHYLGCAHIDKKQAEKIDLLKIDILGLRNLSIVADCLRQIDKPREWLLAMPRDDDKAFKVINDKRFTGIFQFEGYALQALCHQITMESFEDIIALTALARPGPLNSGGAASWVARRNGQEAETYLPRCEAYTAITHGVVVYQEQVMQIGREVGALSWEDVSQLRKAMSRSLGVEYFDQYWKRFLKGCLAKGMTEDEASEVWGKINTMGSWAFNRSHAVAYGLVSYWCMYLKAHYPANFAVSCLRFPKDDNQCIATLRELVREGYEYKPYDPIYSGANWALDEEGVLVGGLIGIKGIAEKSAAKIIEAREAAVEAGEHPLARLTPRFKTLLGGEGETPWDTIFEQEEKWGHIIREPSKFNIQSRIWNTEEIQPDSPEGDYVVLTKIVQIDLRDHNEANEVERRDGEIWKGQTQFLNLVLEDDTGTILAKLTRHYFTKLAPPILNKIKTGGWILAKCYKMNDFRKLFINRYQTLTGNPKYACPVD